jgi:hypothetical protein
MNEKIRRLIDAVKEDRPLDVKKEFAAMTNSKVAQLIEEKKRQIAQKLFRAPK